MGREQLNKKKKIPEHIDKAELVPRGMGELSEIECSFLS